jgi:predicted DNA-binding transcriptional regulator YafY
VTWAKLRFSPDRARWVAAETWHPQQIGSFDPSGRWVLELPYNDPRELLMDVLKHGASVEVLSPESLRRQVISELDAARLSYLGDYAS